MRNLLASLVILCCPALALAQTAALPFNDLSRGLTLLPTSTAFIDEATASNVNPAGLMGVGGAELIYLHERSIARNQVGDGFYLADTFFNAVALGFSTEWMRSTTLPDVRKSTWSLAFGGKLLSAGLGLNVYSGDEAPGLTHLASLNVGLQSRPVRWLSLGASAENVDQPRRDGSELPRRVDFGVGFRPVQERLTLGVDYLVRTDDGFGAGAVQVTAQGEVLPGLLLSLGAARGVQQGNDLRFQAGLTLNTEHFGAFYAFGTSAGGADHVFGVRLSQARYSAIKSPDGVAALVDLEDLLTQQSSALSLLGVGREDDPYLELTRYLDLATRDPDLRMVVVKISSLPKTGLGKADELRHALLRMRKAGKKVIAVLLNAGDTEYFVASAADEIYAVPQAMLLVNGFEAQLLFLGDTMQKLGVHWDVARVGAYKNAPDQLTRAEATPEQLEASNALLDTDVKTVEAALIEARGGVRYDVLLNATRGEEAPGSHHGGGLTLDNLHGAQAMGLVPTERARQLGLIDGVLDSEQLQEHMEAWSDGARYEPEYRPPGWERRWGMSRKIAIVPVIGDIAGGKSRNDPLGLAEIAGAETVVRALKEATEDPAVAAIVLRIDSGGGDGLASDLMYRAVLAAKKKKPVIASMGDVAASGGYYAAMGADVIYASPTTITGSIGVFVLKPALEELASKLGVHEQSLQRGPMSDILGVFRPWTPEEQKAAQAWVDSFYDDFITEAGKSRHLPKEKIDAVARGRVWSGADAQNRGLVDTLGGLADAIEEARRRAHVGKGQDVELAIFGEPHGLFAGGGGENGVRMLAKLVGLSLGVGQPLPPALKALAEQVGLPSLTLAEPGLKAMLPFTVTVK